MEFDLRTSSYRNIVLRLKDLGLFNCHKKEDEVYNLAIIDFILKSKENAEEFMNYGMNNLRFRNHVRKNNKLIKCECYLPITSACESLEIIK